MIWRKLGTGKVRHAWFEMKWSTGWRPLCNLVRTQNAQNLQFASDDRRCKLCERRAKEWGKVDEESEG